MTWRSVHEAHAIERASVIFLFQEDITTKTWLPLIDDTGRMLFSLGFVPVAPTQASGEIIINLGAQLNITQGVNNEMRVFRITRANELIEEIVLQRKSIQYTTTRYSRWQHFRARVASLAENIAKSMFSATNIDAIKMEYVDRFVFEGKPPAADFSEALNAESKYLPRFPQTMKDLWHTHVGYFIVGVNGQKRLINANLDALDMTPRILPPESSTMDAVRRSLGIYTMAEDRFREPGARAPDTLDQALVVADQMHAVLKDVLRDIINPKLADSISLGPKEA